MKTIIYDVEEKEIKKLKINKDDVLINAKNCKYHCVGCFKCWIKHPKKCCYNDNYNNLGELLGKSDELIIISKSRYGCYSSSIKRVFERCIGYVLPYFTIRNKEIHHESRYKNKLKLTTYFYGNIDNNEKICLEKLVKANSININVDSYEIKYIKNIGEIKNV